MEEGKVGLVIEVKEKDAIPNTRVLGQIKGSGLLLYGLRRYIENDKWKLEVIKLRKSEVLKTTSASNQVVWSE